MAQNSQINKPAKTTRKRNSAKKAEPVLVLQHAELVESGSEVAQPDFIADELVIAADPLIEGDEATVIEASNDAADTSDADAIDSLLAELDAPAVTLSAPVAVVVEASDADLHAAVGSAEAVEASIEAATVHGDDGSTPTGDASDVEQPAADAAPADGDAATAAPKRAAVPRKHYTDKTERLKDRVGADLQGFTVLTLADASVDATELAHRMEETMAIIKGMNKKEQNRATGFIEFLAGKKASLNEVLRRALTVLERDGHVSMGKDGNLLADLIARPYSPAAARAMGGNTLGMFEDLKVIQKDPANKGRFIANPESTLLPTVMAKLAAAAPAAPIAP